MNSLRIAIDGGAATGKSTVSKLLAQKLGIRYINTGQMYRLFALVAITHEILDDEDAIYEEIKNFDITYDQDGLISTPNFEFNADLLEASEVGANASVVAAMPKVRQVATEKQIQIGKEPGVLLEGRDIGTVIMPDADFKIFVKVDPVVAAERRVNQHLSLGEDVDFDKILHDIIERNDRDANREIAPLVPTEESIIIDTSNNTPDELVEIILKEVTHG